MDKIDYLIIGGGIAGTTAAETIRSLDKTGSIAIISDEPYPLYSRIMLSKPNFFLEKIPLERIWLKNEEWYKEKNIKLLAGKKAVSLNPLDKTVYLSDQKIIKYSKLLLALGSQARRLDVPGSKLANIFYLRTLDDAKGIIQSAKKAKRAAVIGGGFVGFEMANMLTMAGLEVSLLIREEYFWQRALNQKASQEIEKQMAAAGVKIIKKAEIGEFIGSEKIKGIKLKNNQEINCDLAVIGIGVICPLPWLEKAGLQTNRGLITNEYLETNLPGIWAAGDVAEFKDLILNETIQLGNWANAQQQGIIAGKNMTGHKEPYANITSYSTHGFGFTITFVGLARSDENTTIIERNNSAEKSFIRLFIKSDRIIGATLINSQPYLGIITNLIKNRIDIKKFKEKISQPDFDLKTLIQKNA